VFIAVFTLMPWSKQDACFVIFCIILFTHLGHYYGVTAMLLIHPQFSPIIAIELCSWFKIPNGLIGTSLSSFLPVLQLSSEGLYLWCVGVV
jgi:hypothetical protein